MPANVQFKTGTKQTISLQSTNAVIAAATYPQDPAVKATISEDRMSIEISVVSGIEDLVVSLTSDVDEEEDVKLVHSTAGDLDFITVSSKVGGGRVSIEGV